MAELQDIHEATVRALKDAGMTRKQASAIHDYFKQNRISKLDDLRRLNGISPASIEKLGAVFSPTYAPPVQEIANTGIPDTSERMANQGILEQPAKATPTTSQIDANILTLPAEGETSAGRKPAYVPEIESWREHWKEKYGKSPVPVGQPSAPSQSSSPSSAILNEYQRRGESAIIDAKVDKFIKDNNLSHLNIRSDGVSVKSEHAMERFQKEANRWEKRLGNRQEALEKIARRYNLALEYDNSKRSMMDRIFGRNNHINEESLIKAYEEKMNAQLKLMNDSNFSIRDIAKISEHGPRTDKRMQGYLDRGGISRPTAGSGATVEKSGFGWKGKLGGGLALLALGGVIGNMFSGGHKSNAELYNPNPQPQYYS